MVQTVTPVQPTLFKHIYHQIPSYSFDVILDIGANIGQSCTTFALAAPSARIFAFEPVPATYEKLLEGVSRQRSIQCFNLALGATSGEVLMSGAGTSTMNRVLSAPDKRAISVPMTKGDDFCAEHRIDRISFLKIDTEGHDLEVLRGFDRMLPRTDFVQVEASMNPYNSLHVPFRALEDRLRAAGFALFYMYDQVMENAAKQRPVQLRRCNPVFINQILANRSATPA